MGLVFYRSRAFVLLVALFLAVHRGGDCYLRSSIGVWNADGSVLLSGLFLNTELKVIQRNFRKRVFHSV
ncbi:hypothetical protein R1flu_007323 [Riccia fluitans]|uniref:Secreted protein n=1 Tax=Riccia fluitans TaxID=41844 RepID=A0ABD1Z177_9MARC